MAAPASPPAALPPNWHTATAPDGQEYYFNELTRETSWTAPAPQAAAARTCLTGTTAIDWSDHGLTAANKSRRCTAAYSHHLTPTTAVVNIPAATNVPAAAHPHHSCDGVDGRPTAQLSFIAQQQATARAAASALQSGLLRVRGRVEGGVQ